MRRGGNAVDKVPAASVREHEGFRLPLPPPGLVAGSTTSVGSAQNCASAGPAWQSVPPVSYTVKTSGDSLTVNVQEKPAVSGANFAFDNIALVAGTTVDSTPQELDYRRCAANGETADRDKTANRGTPAGSAMISSFPRAKEGFVD